jgi:hypothetical protein
LYRKNQKTPKQTHFQIFPHKMLDKICTGEMKKHPQRKLISFKKPREIIQNRDLKDVSPIFRT